jgi:hypothetical protein
VPFSESYSDLLPLTVPHPLLFDVHDPFFRAEWIDHRVFTSVVFVGNTRLAKPYAVDDILILIPSRR